MLTKEDAYKVLQDCRKEYSQSTYFHAAARKLGLTSSQLSRFFYRGSEAEKKKLKEKEEDNKQLTMF